MADLLSNKRKYLVILVSFIFISSLFFSFSTQSRKVESLTNEPITYKPIITNWWNASWQYSTQVEIDNPGFLLTNYSVKIEIPFYFDYENTSDIGSDIRFTYQDNITLLNHWIEEWDNDSESIVWIKVPTLEAFSTKTILLYYGNSLANDISNGTLVFDAFDDFSGSILNENLWNVTTWAEGGSRNYGISDSELNVNITTASTYGLYSGYQFKLKENFTYENFALTVRSRWQNLDYYRGYGVFNGPLIMDNNSDNTHLGIGLWGGNNAIIHQQIDGDFSYHDVSDYTSGNSLFEYKIIDDVIDLVLSGTYNSGITSYGSIINKPFNIWLESVIDGRDESETSVSVYYDYIYLR
ncbi:MAG: DUF2341 domain-containing protein, partial [Candidatus Heimdallarchaeota archaeon]